MRKRRSPEGQAAAVRVTPDVSSCGRRRRIRLMKGLFSIARL